jgi:glutamyl-tRNA synthetase/glutamyl-Q tRNA(Asp) synthetase
MVTRFAPSMTGYLHLGHLLHLVWVYAVAERLGLAVRLRIEDHDVSRARPEYETAVLADLAAFGFDWSEEPLRQREHADYYEAQLLKLVEAGVVYGCACSRREIAKGQLGKGQELVYRGTCADKQLSLTGHTVRFRVPEGTVRFVDERLGLQEQIPVIQCGDVALRDRHGQFTYQFACVCDDIRQGITHVVRGEDVLSSTARQLQLFGALGGEPPAYLHHPLLRNAAGEKLSKRERAASIRMQLASGVVPEQLLAEAVGSPEPLSLSEAIVWVCNEWDTSVA